MLVLWLCLHQLVSHVVNSEEMCSAQSQSACNTHKPGKLYYTPTSCGAASFIAAYVGGVNLETEQVNLKSHQTSTGKDYYLINPKGNVPGLVLSDGTLLNEGAAVLQYIADQAPGSVAAENGSVERYKIQNALNYIASEVHPSIGGLFTPGISEEVQNFLKARAAKKLDYLEKTLIGDKEFLVGEKFSIADSYLYIVLSWSGYVGVDISGYTRVQAYYDRIASLPKVKEAHARMAENPESIF
eukprot:TRINITY_DN3448_c0_g1_i1.p1 TRINITY_DN3448_c0_g1~~TRINITY_DN3448_c0_g1_i1.p1  ORF type:complete len:249 (+),score=40.95 TRINITY_DN3448_c0_g1_i1:22-747(+)